MYRTAVSRGCMFLSRLALSAFAVLLLWLTTLDLARSVANGYFPSPDPDVVYASWGYTVQTTSNEEATYSQCATRQTAACNVRINQTISSLVAQLRSQQAQNAARVQSSAVASQSCAVGAIDVLNALNAYTAAGGVVYYRNGSDFSDGGGGGAEVVCSNAELGIVQTTLADTSVVKQNAYVLGAQYQRDADRILSNAVNSASNRTLYDRQYSTSTLPSFPTHHHRLTQLCI